MARISQTSIEELRSRVNIYDLVSQYVSLKKSGSAYKGLSPFTNEKTPSFFVYPDKGFYYCFSTSQGGDLFKFVQVKENLSYREAVEFIANRFSVKLEYEASANANESSARSQIFDMHEKAAQWYAEQFFADTPEATEIRDYWTNERGFTLEQARELRIGFAPASADGLKKIFHAQRYSPKAVAESGLFSAREGETRLSEFYPRFRGRMMIPICDIQGRVIAFTARKTRFTPNIASEEGKYVNSRDTAIFLKKHVVFNMDKARNATRESNYCIVVEGQLDAIRMYCSGFKNTVATQGTAAGLEHFNLIRRFAEKVVLLFDGDSAGRHAALRVIPICFQAGVEPYVAPLPSGEDPDSFIKNNGVDAMRELVENGRKTALSFAASAILEGEKNPDSAKKRAALSELFGIVDCAGSSVIRDDYLREISAVLRADYLSILEDYKAWRAKSSSSAKYENNAPDKNSPSRSQGMLTNSVLDALFVCLNHENVAEAMSGIVRDDWITGDSLECGVFKKLMALYREGIGFSMSEASALFEDEAELNLLYGMSAGQKAPVDNPVRTANECLKKIYKKHIESEMNILNKELSEADRENSDRKFEILRQISNMRKAMKNVPEIEEASE